LYSIEVPRKIHLERLWIIPCEEKQKLTEQKKLGTKEYKGEPIIHLTVVHIMQDDKRDPKNLSRKKSINKKIVPAKSESSLIRSINQPVSYKQIKILH